MIRLSALLTLVGTPEDARAQEAFWAFSALFFHGQRISRWSMAIDAIPPEEAAVLRITRCAQEYQVRFGASGRSSLQGARYKLDEVVKVMVQISNPEVYIKDLQGVGFEQPGAIFHPNTLRQARKTMRGALTSLGERSRTEHLEQIKKKVRRIGS